MQNTEQERHSWLKLIILFIYIFILGVMTILGDGEDVGMNLDNPNTVMLLKILQTIIVLVGFIIIPSLMFLVFWIKTGIRHLGVTIKPSIVTLLLAGVCMLLAMPLINWLSELNQHMKLPEVFSNIEAWMKQSEEKATIVTEAFTRGTSVGVLILNLFVIAFMAAISEEFFFRGILQNVIIECFKNKHIGVWFSAIVFSAFHMQFYGFLPRMLMGAYLGYLLLWSGSLWPGILAHFVNNGMAVYLVWLANREVISKEIDKVGMQQDEWIYVIISSVLVAVCLFFVFKLGKKRQSLRESSVTPEQAE